MAKPKDTKQPEQKPIIVESVSYCRSCGCELLPNQADLCPSCNLAIQRYDKRQEVLRKKR
jgi:hypothetical protein